MGLAEGGPQQDLGQTVQDVGILGADGVDNRGACVNTILTVYGQTGRDLLDILHACVGGSNSEGEDIIRSNYSKAVYALEALYWSTIKNRVSNHGEFCRKATELIEIFSMMSKGNITYDAYVVRLIGLFDSLDIANIVIQAMFGKIDYDKFIIALSDIMSKKSKVIAN